ncbi:hypothetical protein LLH23_18970 [bacterium]|nr:hypothetical protein [bacterium]
MKRCFMTGKQCIFSSNTSGPPATMTCGDLSVFVITPFKTNFDAFDDWSLFPYLEHEYGLCGDNLRRADHVRSTGYIVCEKICHVLQETDLVIADITFPNPNVFYELGLAYGLERPIIFMVNDADKTSPHGVMRNDALRNCLALDDKKVLLYPGVAPINPESSPYALEEHVTTPPQAQGMVRELKISVLKTKPARPRVPGHSEAPDDITLDVYGLLEGAVAVAMSDIVREVQAKEDKAKAPWEQVLSALADESNGKREPLKQANMIEVGPAATFQAVAEALGSSFCTIIDVSENDPLGLFWLGYCHGRGLDAIPFDRKPIQPVAEDTHEIEPNPRLCPGARKRLAFDIRALWYMEHDDQNAAGLKSEIQDILTRLLERDLPDRQRRAFWDRFPREKEMKILTGAIHNDTLNREMVGDWDVRTVSDLVSYLTQVREPSSIKLATPLYSPEHAYPKDKPNREVFLQEFYAGIGSELSSCSAVVIASADVNPVTEYLLHRVYGLGEPVPEPWTDPSALCGYVALKRFPAPNKTRQDGAAPQDQARRATDEEGFTRRFYSEVHLARGRKQADRGFVRYVYGKPVKPLLENYKAQDDPGEFKLLGHLLVARWSGETEADRRRGRDEEQLIVLLNGVSGPATSALAEILTGGPKTKPQMMAKAEEMLAELNEELNKPGWDAVEAIVEVQIKPARPAQIHKYRDSREVVGWSYAVHPRPFTRRSVVS